MSNEQVLPPITYPDNIAVEQSSQMREDSGLTQWQLDLDESIDLFVHTMKGEVKGKKIVDGVETETWEVKNEKMINDKGIAAIETTLRLRATKNTILSNFTENEIKALLCYPVHMSVAGILFHAERFQLKKVYRRTIIDQSWSIMYAAAMRAKGGGERGSLRDIRKEIHQTTIQSEPRHKAWFNPF